MSFRLVPKSVTLNNPERHNGRYSVNCALTLMFAYFLVAEQYHVDGAIRKLKLCILRLGRRLYTLQCRQSSLVISVRANDVQIGPECRSG